MSLLSILHTIMLARALFVACELNIAEYLEKKPMTLHQLATTTGTHEQALGRLMYFLELNDIFTKHSNGTYHLTEFSKTMNSDHPKTIKPFLLHDDETRWNSFGNLGYSIATGNASFDMLYGESYFDYLAKHPHLSKRFDEAMTIVSHEEDKRIAQLISFQGTIADIGGGKGQLLEAIISSHPTSKGILFDLPEAIHAAPSNPSITKIVGNFFAPMHIDANTFILKRILHDWDDKKALDILNNISNTMDKNATLYIIDGLLDQAQDKKLLSAIDLVLLTIFKGQERTLQEMRSLAQQANLEIVQYFPINDLIFVLECKRI